MQASCLLYTSAAENAMCQEDVEDVRRRGRMACYVYDVLDLENVEFTPSGLSWIRKDLKQAITWGFTHIMLANPYIIELVTNEFARDIQVVISPQLEFDSERAAVFLEGLNNPVGISHVIVPTNRLTGLRLRELERAFSAQTIIVELDRWSSNVQLVNDRYFNVLHGSYHAEALGELQRLTSSADLLKMLRRPDPLFLSGTRLIKVGEIVSPPSLVTANLEAARNRRYDSVTVVDLHLWRRIPLSS
jgi:hypothetical protein